MSHGGGAGDEQHVGGALEEPGKGYDHRCGFEGGGRLVEGGGLQGREAAEGKERDIRDAFGGEGVQEGVVFAVGHVVVVLHTDDPGDGTGFIELLLGDVAEAEVLNKALLL